MNRSPLCTALALSIATLVCVSARAGEPPAPGAPKAPDTPKPPVAPVAPAKPAAPPGGDMQGPPPPRPAITNAYLRSLVGTWDLVIHSTQGGDQKGTSTIRLALDGTAVVEEMTDGATYSGLGVQYVAPDGKGLNLWWFDTMGEGGMWPWRGTFVDGGYDLAGEGPGGTKATSTMRKKDDGHVFEMKMNGQSVMTIQYAKAAKPAVLAPIAREKGPKSAMIDLCLGDWTVSGVSVIEAMKLEVPHAGSSSFRLGVGGAYLIQDYEIQSAMEHSFVLGVIAFGPDGKSVRFWSFGNTMDGPIEVPGTVDGTTMKASLANTPFGGAFGLVIAKKGDGFETVTTVEVPIGKIVVTETYTRKK